MTEFLREKKSYLGVCEEKLVTKQPCAASTQKIPRLRRVMG